MYKFSFCYFYHDEIYLLHKNFHEFSLEDLLKLKMIVEMENYKFEVKRVTHLKAIDMITHHYYVILYLSWKVLLPLSDAIFGFKY